jgi:hypothetical protein
MKPEESDNLEGMSDDEVIFLMKSLTLKAKYNEDRKRILTMIKFMLVK